MRDVDDTPLRTPATHEIGMKLDELSVFELDARIQLLREEMVRLEQAKNSKQKALAEASSFFKS